MEQRVYITYRNGTTIEAVIVSKTETTIRAAVQGADDIQELSNIHGTWVSDDWEPVRLEFETERRPAGPVLSEVDCICPKEHASRLLQLLFSGEAPVTLRP